MLNLDTQANLGFVVGQTSHIETQVYQMRFPEIRYQGLIPVDTSANPWATSVTYFSQDMVGKAEWISGKASDIPTVSGTRQKYETAVYMAGIGYDFSEEEVNQARMLGINLSADYAAAARRAYEQMVDGIALTGDTTKGFQGLFNYSGVTAATVPNGAASSPLWANKTAEEVMADVNNALIAVHVATNTVAMADTLLLPVARLQSIASRRIPDTDLTILDFIKKANVYTAETGRELTIRGVRGLETAGAGGTARMISYRRAPDVLKLHIPMPHKFYPAQQIGLQYVVPGVFRLGGLDIRLPKEVLYSDGL